MGRVVNSRTRLGTLLFIVSTCFVFMRCGRQGASLSVGTNGEMVEIPFSLGAEGGRLSLATALSNVNLAVTGCASGYNPTNFTLTGSTVNFFKGDVGCLVKLCSFTYNGENYVNQTPPCGVFNTGAGSLTAFSGTTGGVNPGGDTVYAYVDQQISAPIGPGVSVQFYILEADAVSSSSLTINSTVVTVENNSPSTAPFTVAEGTSVSFKFRRLYPNPPPATALVVKYSLVGSAVAGVDYTAQSGTITIPANTSSAILTIPLLNNGNAKNKQSLGVYIENSSGFQGSKDYISYGSPAVMITNTDTAYYNTTPNFVMHFDPSTMVGTGNLTGWNHVSPTTIDVASVTGTITRYSGVLNGYDGAGFDGNSYLKINSNASISNSASTKKIITGVFTTGADINSRQVIYEQGNSTSGLNVYIYNGKVYAGTWPATSGSLPVSVSTPVSASTSYVFTIRFDSSTGLNSIFINGSLVGIASGAAGMSAQNVDAGIGGVVSGGSTKFEDGSTTSSVTGFKGSISDFFHYNAVALTDTQITGLHGFLQTKYNISFPSVSISAVTSNVSETAGLIKGFTVSRAIPTADDLIVYYTVSGTAVAGTNYVSPSGFVTIPAYNTSAFANLTLLNDSVLGTNKTLTITLANDVTNGSSPVTYLGASASASLTIKDYASLDPICWLDAAVNVTENSNGNVSLWGDQTTNNIRPTQSTNSKRPNSITTSTPPLIRFTLSRGDYLAFNQSGAPNYPLLDGGPTFTQKTYAIVFTTGTNVTTKQVVYEQGEATNGMNIIIDTGKIYFAGVFAGVSKSISTPIVASTKYLVVFEFDQPNGQLRGKVNGLIVTPLSYGSTVLTGVLQSSAIGASSGALRYADQSTNSTAGGSPFGGDIYEVIMFNTILDSSKYSELESYLTSKYGL